MIISPPFLPTRTSGQTEAQWLDAAMNGWQPGSGSFPITGDTELWKGNHLLDWHGGVHLKAPSESELVLPVRAIADGTVIFVRQPSAVNVQDQSHPLNYGGGTTSDGVVVIRHDTEIGVDANDHPVEVRFYSLYMHLGSIEAKVQEGKPIYRKDKIGAAGHIYGQPNMIHFEICCDDDNLRKLVGRASDPFNGDSDGRSDVVFGEIYFKLPAGTPAYGQRPHLNCAAAAIGAPPVPLSPIYTTVDELIIGLRYLCEAEGLGQHPGDAVLRTLTSSGESVVPNPGTLPFVTEAEGEYRLYEDAMHIANSYPANARPTPAAVYELLRFGRVIGTDPLHPADVPHWRKVAYPGGEGWVNLNAARVRKFSDADFPSWSGWIFIGDDGDGDSRCDSARLAELIYGASSATNSHSVEEARTQVTSSKAQKALSRVICDIPNEWNVSTLDQRWSWLKVASDVNREPMTEDEYVEFKTHAGALCFPCQELFASRWHFNPHSFVALARRCGWLSKKELVQAFPLTVKHLHLTSFNAHPVGQNALIHSRSQRWAIPLNRALRKYGIQNYQRKAHFLANVWEETGYLRTMEEGGGSNASYAPWWGRGLIQLTHQANYKWFGVYHAFPHDVTSGPYATLGWNPDQRITHDDAHCADTTVYWVNPQAVATGHNALKDADAGLGNADFVNTAKATNGNVAVQNVNGLDGRLQHSIYLRFALGDAVPSGNVFPLSFTWRKSSEKTGVVVLSNGQVKHVFETAEHNIDVNVLIRRPNEN